MLRDAFYVPRSIEDVNKNDNATIEIGVRRDRDIDYIVFYERGVGTGPGLDRLLGGALGRGLGLSVRRAYKFLCRHYVPGSEIFIFGFSRGAYTARSLVGYLGSAGLLQAKHCTLELEKQAWAYYRTSPNDRLPGVQKQLEEYTHPVNELRVACLGVFDTVGALGIPASAFRRANRQQYEFHDVDLSPIVKLNLHALAIDERRSQFEASVWRQSTFRESNSVTEQTWFPGVHADVGGGYFSTRERDMSGSRCLDDITLNWMLKRVRYHYPGFPVGAKFAQTYGSSYEFGLQHESRTWTYRISMPALRAIGNRPPPALANESVVSYDRDATVVGESVHVSALERLGRKVPVIRPGEEGYYLPRNLIENLPDLYQRYFLSPDRSWGTEAVSITSWSGEIVDHRTSKNDVLEEIREAFTNSCGRLKSLGYDVLSPSWNSRSAAQALSTGRSA
jgi:hypothetical protein